MTRMQVRSLAPSTFEIEGELDIASAHLLADVAEAAPDGGDLVLELSNLTFMDSSGLRAILEIVHRRNGTSSVVLAHPTSAVRRVLDIALPGVTPRLRVEPDGSPHA